MSDTSSNTSSGGLGFVGALTIAFIVLKLCHVIHWSWVWVLSPLWISALIVCAILLLLALGFGIYWLIKKGKK